MNSLSDSRHPGRWRTRPSCWYVPCTEYASSVAMDFGKPPLISSPKLDRGTARLAAHSSLVNTKNIPHVCTSVVLLARCISIFASEMLDCFLGTASDSEHPRCISNRTWQQDTHIPTPCTPCSMSTPFTLLQETWLPWKGANQSIILHTPSTATLLGQDRPSIVWPCSTLSVGQTCNMQATPWVYLQPPP